MDLLLHPDPSDLDPDLDLNPDLELNPLLILILPRNLILILNLILIIILNKILIRVSKIILILQERKKANEVDRMVLVGDAKVCSEYYGGVSCVAIVEVSGQFITTTGLRSAINSP